MRYYNRDFGKYHNIYLTIVQDKNLEWKWIFIRILLESQSSGLSNLKVIF